jgi:anti-sigma B factor antagonist
MGWNMKTSIRQIGNVTVVDISGRIVLERTTTLRRLVSDLLDNESMKIVFNLGDAEYVDSAGLGCLVGLLTSVRKRNSDLKLLNPSAKIRNALRITRLDTVFDIFNNEQECLKSFDQSKAAIG